MIGEDNSVKMIQSKHQQSVHQPHQQQNMRKSVGVMGTRRIFTTAFKIKVLDSYRHDKDCRQNQRATARKYGIHRRQIQKWLQCEEQLRNSVENGNTGAVSSASASPTSVSKSESAVTEATGSAVTPATSALNLNLARQHGDELATQQGPPPSHPPHGSAPSSPQYSLQTTTTGTVLPSCVTSVGYQEYSPEERFRLFEENRARVSEVHGYPDTQTDQDRNYYVLNGDGQRDSEVASAFAGRNEVKVYQTLTSYRSHHREHPRYNVNDNSERNHSPNHHHSQHRVQNYGNADSFNGSSFNMLLTPLMIKTEPASPDTAATPGLYEPTGSPSGPRAPLSPVSHRGADSGGSSSNVHLIPHELGSSPASPYLHALHALHAHEHAHTCPSLDSEKPIPSLQHEQEREPEETTRHTEVKREEKEQEERLCRTLIKEEVDIEETCDEGEEVTAFSCVDYQRPPVGGSSPDSSGLVSPTYDRNGYSLPSSPRDSASAGRSRNSLSDSEMDPLNSANSSNLSGNFTRRRSFPLRFKLDVLNAFHRDKDVKENQRATARKFGINRRQVQKWLEQESDLRDEIALRGDSRQRLGPIQDVASNNDQCDSPLDLTTSSYTSLQVSNCISLLRGRLEKEHERLPVHINEDGFVAFLHPPSYEIWTGGEPSSELETLTVCGNLSCSVDSHTTTSTTSSYQELSLRESLLRECYTEPSIKTHCYSSRANSVVSNFSEGCEQRFSPLKRQHCTLPSCCDAMPSSKRFCERYPEVDDPYDVPQDTPLCLVKPKLAQELSRTELITKTINQSISTSNNPDAITFKPYLDNPVSKPVKKCAVQRDLSPISNHSSNNNNCQLICNFNEDQSRNYDIELNLRVPVSWGPSTDVYRIPCTEFPRNSFLRPSLYM
ncbi:PREDICTED: uncharacterized protein LOC105568679 [Vollenhovia emeryi]|uniref:uncharacterized protein LOC105568679 n=1 Tax=Vollenhovia emeryi TaxID=411798 RepID=UPI0005F37107|nr:PREDICTED: uncharacterized protein LOC105568679 [Vollenhovia emeryi]